MAELKGAKRDLLIAAFETRRFQYLSMFLQHPEHVDKALAYAWETRIYPLFHRTHGDVDCFADVYAVKKNFIDDVIKYLDEQWLAAKKTGKLERVGFYDLEDRFGGKGSRSALIHIVRYCFLADRFDDDLYKAIEDNAPG